MPCDASVSAAALRGAVERAMAGAGLTAAQRAAWRGRLHYAHPRNWGRSSGAVGLQQVAE